MALHFAFTREMVSDVHVLQVKEVLHFEAAAVFVAKLAEVVLRAAPTCALLRDTVSAACLLHTHTYTFVQQSGPAHNGTLEEFMPS